jgi:hypothetical protein
VVKTAAAAAAAAAANIGKFAEHITITGILLFGRQ